MLIHVVIATIALFVVHEERNMLFALEGLLALSITLGVLLVRAFFVPLELIRTGSELIEERDFTTHFRETGQPEMDRLIVIYNRMSERLREERLRLEEQNLLLSRIVEASPSGILILDFDGRIEQINSSGRELLGKNAGPLRGLTLGEAGLPVAPLLTTLETGAALLLPNDGRRRIRATAGEFLDRGFPRKFFLIEELTEELRATEKSAYEKLIRLMSHEVNNSVGAVNSLLDSLRHYTPQLQVDEDRVDFENAVEVAINRLSNLEQFMSAFAAVVRLPEARKEPTDVGQLLREIAILFKPELEGRGISVTVETAGRIPTIPLDRNQFEQVLVNSIRNAAESIGSSGSIVLSLAPRRGGATLTIADTGAGLPEEARALLFTPFFTTKREGRGLGLTLIQEILNQHGFDFALRPRAGGGAELVIELKA